MPSDISFLGKKIIKLRDRNGLSQRGLAVRSGVPQSTISRLEKGELRSVGMLTAKKLAEVLKVSVDFLIDSEQTNFDQMVSKGSVSDRVLTSVVENSPHRVLITDADGLILFGNMKPAQIGHNLSTYLDSPQDWENVATAIGAIEETGDPQRISVAIAGEDRGCSLVPILDEGKEVDMISFMFDTPLELVRAELKDSEMELRERNLVMATIQRIGRMALRGKQDKEAIVEFASTELMNLTQCQEIAFIEPGETPKIVSMHRLIDGMVIKSRTIDKQSADEFAKTHASDIAECVETGSLHVDGTLVLMPIPALDDGQCVVAMNFSSNGDLADRFLRWFPVFDQVGVLFAVNS